jgi:membrane fusion protein, multidrug efflux system
MPAVLHFRCPGGNLFAELPIGCWRSLCRGCATELADDPFVEDCDGSRQLDHNRHLNASAIGFRISWSIDLRSRYSPSLVDLFGLAAEGGTTMRVTACVFLVTCGLYAPTMARAEQAPAAGQGQVAVPVGVVTAERKPVTKGLEFVGRVDAVNRVEVKARVTGYLEDVRFKEGDLIKEGAPLYSIERGLFEAAVEQAEGALERSKAAKILTEVQLQRAEDLLAKNSGTAVARDQALAADESAKGAITIDEANLRTAKINLGYTDISSPIAGKVGKTNITKGNVVAPQSGPLTAVVSQDPMYVTFPVSQREFLSAKQAEHKEDLTGIKVQLRFSDGSSYKQTGQINFVDVSVDRSTDTVLVRASFPNPDFALVDGQLVRVALESATPEEKIVIPQAALISDQEGVYVFVASDGKAAIRRVKPSGESGTGIVIEDGLAGGELVIVEGLQSLRAGVPVRASPLPPAPGRS